MKSAGLFVLGVLLLAGGIFFALQGANVVRWPMESFMVGKRDWTEYGIIIAIAGAMAMAAAWRIRK
jgi:hypothetical protein